MIPALRRLAGKQLSDADRAEQLLDRRTNEWLGNGRHSRYLFSWSELRLINKHRRFVTWGKERQAKEELLTASARRFRLQYAAVGLAMLVAVVGWIGWDSNAWQTYLIERELRSDVYSLNDSGALIEIAQAFVYAGDSQFSLQVVKRISGDRLKTDVLRAIAQSYAKLGDKEKASSPLADAIKAVEWISDDSFKPYALSAIAESYAKLGDKEKASSLLADAIKMTERISDDRTKPFVLRAIAASCAKLGETMKVSSLLADAIKMMERIGNDRLKTDVLRAISESYAKLGDKEK